MAGDEKDISPEDRALIRKMQIETNAAFWTPMGAVTRKAARRAALCMVVGAIIGVLISAPFAFINFGFSYPQRLLIVSLIGFVAGIVCGFIVGAGISLENEDDLTEKDVESA